ncbi:hypothetical protein V3H18_04505 [Methylocystis sp. 9N]|uniref:Uncharacterized protein n=1 Tax=Methylocystis borbori TaxID=3118750 RepID=A0ABU7XEI5_9HYPH
MKPLFVCAALLASVASTHAQPTEFSGPTEQSQAASSRSEVSVDYYSATGRLLGSVITIGGTTYFAGPDGAPLGTSTTIDGRKVYRRY